MSMTVIDQPASRPWVALQNPAAELANVIANTDFVKQELRGKPAAITAAILYGDEIGLGPMQSLAKIAFINGRATLEAEALRALVLQRGHELWIEDSGVTKCTVAGRRKDSDQVSRITWTMDDAKRANLAGKQNWRLYPREMLLARASAALCRAIFADAIGGLAAKEELEDVDEGTRFENGPPPKPVSARRKRASITQADPPPTIEPAAELQPPPTPEPEATPESEPESEAEPEPEPPPPMSEAQHKRLQALFRERGFSSSEERRSFASFMLGYAVKTTADLNADQASQLMAILERPTDER